MAAGTLQEVVKIPPATVDIIKDIRNDPAALVVGAMWALYMIAMFIFQNMRNSKQQSTVDSANDVLVKNLSKALEDASKIAREERDRADRLASTVTSLSVELGQLRADLKHSDLDKIEFKKTVDEQAGTIEALVLEARSKDKSITRLVGMNRQILRAIGSNPEALQIGDGTGDSNGESA